MVSAWLTYLASWATVVLSRESWAVDLLAKRPLKRRSPGTPKAEQNCSMARRWMDSRSPRACGRAPPRSPRRVGHLLVLGQRRRRAAGTSSGMCDILPAATPPPEKERGLLSFLGSAPRVCSELMILQSWLCMASWSTWRPLSSASWLDWIPRALLVEEEILRVERAGAVLFALLRIDARPRER